MLMDRIKNWLKLLALWAWVHFITLLASDPDSVPKLKYVTEEDGINILADETTDVDQIKSKKKRKNKLSHVEERNEEESVIKQIEETDLKKGNDFICEEISKKEQKRNSDENESLEKSQLEDEEEKDDKDEEDDIPWLGVGRGTGLTRYSGIQNLLDTTNTTEEPLIVERRQPVLIPRRDGPLVLQRPSFGRSLSHEKERLSEIPEEEKQSPPSFNNDVSNESDKLWASLVARYGKEDEADKINLEKDISRCKDHIFDVEAMQQPIFTSPEESISSEEFSNQVEERLQRYLSKIDKQNMLAEANEIENLADETEAVDEETREMDEYEVDTPTFDENGRLGKENKIFILIEDDDSNEEKEENVDRKFYEALIPDDNFSVGKFEVESMGDYQSLKAITEEEETISDYDDLQFDSSSNLITKVTELQPIGNKADFSDTILDTEFMSVAAERSPDYFKNEDDDYQEDISDEEDVIEEEKTAVFTISLHKKPETSLLHETNDDVCTTGITSAAVDCESPIVVNDASNKFYIKTAESEVDKVDNADKKDLSFEFLTKERRQSRDLWKIDCEKFLGEQESSQDCSLEEREDFIFTTYDEFPEDCVPVAEGLLAITEKFGIPLDVETPKDDEEEDDSIVDSVFEEPRVLVDNDEITNNFSEVVSDETNSCRDDELTTEKHGEADFFEYVDKSNFIPGIANQEENFVTAKEKKIYEPLELETNEINNVPYVTTTEKLDITAEESLLKRIASDVQEKDTDQEIARKVEQYGEIMSGMEDVIPMNQEAYDLESVSVNVKEEDTVENEVNKTFKSDYEETEASILLEPFQEKSFSILLLEKHLLAGSEDNEDLTDAVLEENHFDVDMNTEDAPSSEYSLEKLVKEEPVLDFKYHVICDIDFDDFSIETSENLRHSILEEHAEIKLDDSPKLEAVIESELIQILEQMEEEEPEKVIDAENNFEKNSEVTDVCADETKSSVCEENISESFINELTHKNVKKISQKDTKIHISAETKALAPYANKSYKSDGAISEQDSNEQKKTVAKVKKGKLDSILKRFEEKEEPVIKKLLPKKRFEVKAMETKPTTVVEIKIDPVMGDEHSSEQKATSISSVPSNKEESLEENTPNLPVAKVLSPIVIKDNVEAILEESPVFTLKQNISQIDASSTEGISEIQTSKDNLKEKSSTNVIGELTEITVEEKSLDNQSSIASELAIDAFSSNGTEKLKEVILPTFLKEEMCSSEKKEVGDSLGTTKEDNVEISFKQISPSEAKAEHAEPVIGDQISDNIVTVTLPRRKKLLIPKNFEETSEPKQMVKTAVKKGKLDNILKRFEEKESKPTSIKVPSKLDSSSKKAFEIKSKDLELSLSNLPAKDVKDNELETKSLFLNKDSNKDMEIVLIEEQVSTTSEVVNEPIKYDHESLKTIENSTLDCKKECVLSSLESSTDIVSYDEHEATVKVNDETKCTASIKSEADSHFNEKLLDETPLELERSDKSPIEKDSFVFNFQEKALPLNKKKSTSLLNLGPEKIHEQFIEDGESYYVLDEIKQQQETLNVVDIDVEKEKSYWFDSKENLREAEILSERKASIKDESTFWFEEVSTQHENDTSSFWFEENSANNIQEETVPNESTENIASKDETLTDVVNIETKKRHSYFSEEDDDLYFLRKAEGEKPFTEEKDEELALLRKETMELSKPKKIKKDFEDTKSVSERPFSGNIKSSEISEEDRLEKERILCAIRSEREVSKSGVIPEEEIPDYLDDVKDLLVPKIRRKKGRRNTALDDLMKVDEPDLLPKVVEISKKDLKYKQPLTTIVTANVEAIDAQQSYITSDSFENEESEPVSNKFLTEEEEYELIEIQREQEALRASQRKELEKYLSMPAALTEQEQLELEELLAEEETDRTVNAVSEARLEALLNEVRKRIGNSEMDLDTAAALEEYIGLPIGLTEEEELLLSNVGEEKDRNQFASDDEYRDYIKQRYLDELEDERIRVEEDEYEFGGYYEDDYEYDGDEDYDEEFMEEDYDLMESDNTHQAPIMKDEAVGGDEPMDSEMGELKKSKSLLASLSSLRSKGSKSSSGSLDKQGSNYSSKEGSSSDLQKESSSHTQSKKFFRYGGLSIKRKKKSKIFSEIDPGIKNEDILSVNELPQNLVFKHNDAFDIENNDYILASSPVETEFNKNENCSCDSDEAFVIISKDIFNSITNFCAHESIETAPPCQDSPTNKITGSDIFNSTLYNECKSKNESKAQKSNQFEKGISNFIDPTLPTLLLPEREHEENDSKDSINEINIDTSVDINSIHEGCSSSLNDSSISESLEVIDSEKRECSKPSNCEIPNIIITDVSNITTKIFSLLKQKTVQQRNRPISPLNQIQNTMTISSNTDANTNKGVKILQRDGEQHSTKKSDINNGSNSSEPLTYLDNHFSLINDVIDNKETPSGKSRLIEEAKLKVSKMSEVTSGPDAVSALEEDSLEYQSPAADVVSAASNFAQVPPTYPLKSDHSFTHNSNQMSLQELIEAELNSRLAPLQPDSLEGGGLPDYHEHIRTTVTNGDATATCSSLLDSLEASPFSLDSLVDVESGVDLTSPPNPALGGSPPSPYSPFIHNSSSNQFNNINLNGHQKSNLSDIPENKTSITSEAEDDFEILESLPSKKVNDLKTENLIQDFTETNENLELSETIITEVKDIPESNDIILIDEDDNVEDMEHVVVENITFEINTTSETVLESHCLQNGLTNGFEQKAEKSFIEHKIVEKQLYNVKQETLNEMFIMSEEKVETCSNGLSEVDIQEQKSKPVEDVSETTLEDTTNSLDKEIISPAYDLIINDFHEIEQPKTASTFEKFYQADSFSDFKINHFNKSESVDKSTTIYQQSEVVSSKISNVDFLETVDSTNDPNESNNFSQSEDSKLNNFSQSEDSKINNFSQSEDSKLTNFNQSESLPMETNHKLITNIVDVSNSYNIIDVINNKDVVDVYNNGLLPADVHVTNMEETELWPEEEDGKKEEMDEFQKMEQEVEREMEEEQKKKKKSDTDKRGKKKKKRKGESEKENKRKVDQEVQFPEVNDYPSENEPTANTRRTRSKAKKKEETIRYEWCREGDTNRVIISFITPEIEKGESYSSPNESLTESEESIPSSAPSIVAKSGTEDRRKSLLNSHRFFGSKRENLIARQKEIFQAEDSQIKRRPSFKRRKTCSSSKVPSNHSGYYEIEGIQVKKKDKPSLRKKTSNISVITISMVQTSKFPKQYIPDEEDSLLCAFRKHPPSSIPDLKTSLVIPQFQKLSTPLPSSGAGGEPYRSECTITFPARTVDSKPLIYRKSDRSTIEDQQINFMSCDYPKSSLLSFGYQKFSLPLIPPTPHELRLHRSKLKRVPSSLMKEELQSVNQPELLIREPKAKEVVTGTKLDTSERKSPVVEAPRPKSRLPVPIPKFKETFLLKPMSSLKKMYNATSDRKNSSRPFTPSPKLKRATFSPNLVRANRKFASSPLKKGLASTSNSKKGGCPSRTSARSDFSTQSSPIKKGFASTSKKGVFPSRTSTRSDVSTQSTHFPRNTSLSSRKKNRDATTTKAFSVLQMKKSQKDPLNLKGPKSILKSFSKTDQSRKTPPIYRSTSSLPASVANRRSGITTETFRPISFSASLPGSKVTNLMSKIPLPSTKVSSKEPRQHRPPDSPHLPIKIDTSAPVSRLILHNFFSVTPKGDLRRYPLVITSNFKELSPFLLNNSFSSADEEVDYDDVVIDDVINGATRLNGLHSPFENDKQDHHDQLTTVENDDLANISVKQLTASYLSVAEQSPRKRSPSPNSTPIRPRTPISRLVGTYSSSQTPAAATHSPATVHASTPNGTANHIYPSDFTPGITLKSLKSAYEASAQKRPSPCASPVKEEVHVSFSQLREAYCNVVASHSPREGNSPTPRSTTPLITPSTFRSMTRSCCDIRMACKDYEVPSPPAYKVDVSLLNVSVKALTRSFSDLTRMGTAVTRNGSIQQPLQSPQGNSFGSRKVSVKELRKSYEDLPRALIIDVTSDRKLTSPNRHNNLLTTTNTRLNCSYTNIHLCANFSGSDLQKIAQAGGPKNPPFTGVSVINRKTAYQSKDELYEKHVGPRIRSFDAAKMKSKFNKPKEPTQVSNDCRICGKLVFQMEKIVAEKASWHKNCFRCSECNKNLTLETYQSHEGSLYCKPHFKELFRPKAVVQDEAEERKDRLLRRPRMIILESQPEILPDDVVRATEKPDYGLDELQTSLNVKERFAVFESYSKAADEPKLEPVSVRRSQSLMSKAARFSNGHQNGDLEDEEEEEYESGEEMEGDEEEGGEDEDPNYVKSRKKKERPMSFSGMGDLKAVWEQKQRREEMTQARKEDITKFRQMLCAGKNITLKEMFESGNFEGADDEDKKSREEIKIEDRRAAHNLKARFEKGQPFILEDEEGSEDGSRTSTLVGEKQEVEEVFRDAQTAKQARNVFKQIDSKVIQEGSVILRSPSFAMQNRDNRRSLDISLMMPQRSMSTAEVVKSSEPVEEELQLDTTDLANRFKFFATFEERQKEETEKKRKVFRITPPREGAEQVEETLLKANIKPCMAPNCTVCKLRGLSHGSDDSEVLGRDPNLIKCTDNYQDEIDCRNTKNILQMFKKMEMGQEEEEDEEGPRPLKCFTPPPEDGDGEESEYSDEEYSDEGEDDETDEDEDGKPKFKDELLEMEACPQSARKAANLRAKFEKWEVEVERKNELNRDKDSELEEECRPSLDTTRNLKAMFEHKAIEVTKPVTSKPVSQKINRFVGGGEKCMACDKTVYAMEKLEIHGKILHKNCFKCFKCNSRLSMGSFSFGGEQMFCTTHYKQLFTEKGSYDAFLSGKDKWTSKIEATNSEAIKSHD